MEEDGWTSQRFLWYAMIWQHDLKYTLLTARKRKFRKVSQRAMGRTACKKVQTFIPNHVNLERIDRFREGGYFWKNTHYVDFLNQTLVSEGGHDFLPHLFRSKNRNFGPILVSPITLGV